MNLPFFRNNVLKSRTVRRREWQQWFFFAFFRHFFLQTALEALYQHIIQFRPIESSNIIDDEFSMWSASQQIRGPNFHSVHLRY